MVADSTIVHIADVVSGASMRCEDGDEPVPEFHEVAVATAGSDGTMIDKCMREADEALVEARSLLLANAPRATAKATAA